jgi:hypothetical protein
MNTFQELIDSYRVCRYCKADDCQIEIINDRGKHIPNDILKNYLRLYYAGKIFKIKLDENLVTCHGYGNKKYNFSRLEINFSINCLNCGGRASTESAKVNEKLSPSQFTVRWSNLSNYNGDKKFIHHFSFHNGKIKITKSLKKGYKEIYNIEIDFPNFDNLLNEDLHSFISRAEKLQAFT